MEFLIFKCVSRKNKSFLQLRNRALAPIFSHKPFAYQCWTGSLSQNTQFVDSKKNGKKFQLRASQLEKIAPSG